MIVGRPDDSGLHARKGPADPLPGDVRQQVLPWLSGPGDACVPVLTLRHPAWRDATAQAYSGWLQAPHLAPGAACGLQHYTGRLLSVVVIVWALTGQPDVLAS